MTVDLREIYHLALSAAEEAGRIHQERLHFERTIETKSSPADAVTEVDRACEELIVSRIVAARPDDSIVGEEGADRVGTSGVSWYLDPLDGTVNYVYRRHDFSVSIGVEVDGRARPYCEALMERGILAKETHTTVIRFAPPLVIERETLEWAADEIEAVLKA